MDDEHTAVAVHPSKGHHLLVQGGFSNYLEIEHSHSEPVRFGGVAHVNHLHQNRGMNV